MYSQSDEEKIILENVPETGCFLDIGALDGKTYSNTLALVEIGWKGVCIEPNPESFYKLQQLHGDNNKIILINAILGSDWQLKKFYSNNQAVSTTEESHYEKWKNDKNWKMNFNKIYSCVLPACSLFEKFPGPYDFINIDTESTNLQILYLIKPYIDNTNLVCIEYDDSIDTILNIMKEFNVIHKTGENIILKRKS